jgi:uncharacterized sulfatase
MQTRTTWILPSLILLVPVSVLAAAPPNIVVFISDDHSYADSQVAGNQDVRTPNLVRLAADGVHCTQAFAVSPSCAPSRAAILTGLAPVRNGSMFNHQPPRDDVKKLPAYLKELGYECVACGKVAHYEQVTQYGFDRAERYRFHDDQCVAAAIEYLRQRKPERPLCLMVGTNWPHVPWPEATAAQQSRGPAPPSTHVDTPETRQWRSRYYAAVEKMDADLGAIYDAAYEVLGENTLFIHFSDHGAQWPFAKWNLYDAGLHVPFLAAWPGHIEAGSKTDAMVSLLDVLPTLVEAAGGAAPAGSDGKSLLPLFLARTTSPHDELFFTHSGDGRMNEFPMRGVRTERFKYIRSLRPEAEYHTHIDLGVAVDGREYWDSWVAKAASDPTAQAIVERYFHRPAEEFYDLESDFDEQHNLIAEPGVAEEVAAARERLNAAMAKQGDSGLATERQAADEFDAWKNEHKKR